MRTEDWELPEGDELDAMIESALRSEPMLTAPLHLHRKVEERVRLIALHDHEVARFRYSMMSLLLAFLGAFGLGAAVVVFTNFELLLANGLPGGGGLYDRYSVFMSQSWSSYSGTYLFAASMSLALGTLLLAWIPLRNYLRTH
jgi:hypothetical protein